MRRLTLVLVCLVGLSFAGAGVAQAGHGRHHKGYCGPPVYGHGHHGKYRGYAGYRGPGWYGARPVYGYPAPVYPAYPAPTSGFAVGTPNFSLWFGQ